MLSLDARECTLGARYGGKKKRDEETRTFKLDLSAIVLSREEVNTLLGEPHAYEALYDTSATPIAPFLTSVKALELKHAWDGATVSLLYALGVSKCELKNARLTRMRIEPRVGGDTAFSCTVEGVPPLDKHLTALIERVGTRIECELHAEAPAEQDELPLSRHGENEQLDASEQPRPRKARKSVRGVGARKRRNGVTRLTTVRP